LPSPPNRFLQENIRAPANKSTARLSARIDVERFTFSRHVAVTYYGLINATPRGGEFVAIDASPFESQALASNGPHRGMYHAT